MGSSEPPDRPDLKVHVAEVVNILSAKHQCQTGLLCTVALLEENWHTVVKFGYSATVDRSIKSSKVLQKDEDQCQ